MSVPVQLARLTEFFQRIYNDLNNNRNYLLLQDLHSLRKMPSRYLIYKFYRFQERSHREEYEQGHVYYGDPMSKQDMNEAFDKYKFKQTISIENIDSALYGYKMVINTKNSEYIVEIVKR